MCAILMLHRHSQVFTLHTFSKDLLPTFAVVILPCVLLQDTNKHFDFSVFASRPMCLLIIKLVCFSLQCLCPCPVNQHHQQRPEADWSHSISIPAGLLGPSSWHMLNLETMSTKHLLTLENNRDYKHLPLQTLLQL